MADSIFLSVGEPSGDLHAANLVKALRSQAPGLKFTGLGGPRMRAEQVELLYPLAEHPIMGFRGALAAIPFLRKLHRRLDEHFERVRPRAVVLVDNPGFNWHVAKLAKKHHLPVIYFIPPQIWAWASHRVRKMRRLVDLALCSLPFEEAWYQSHGLDHACYIGHPFFDDLAKEPIKPRNVTSIHPPRVVLLPGSRMAEAKLNAPLLLASARKIQAAVPDVEFNVAAFTPAIAHLIGDLARKESLRLNVGVGQTREFLASATAAISVSGSVSLELLHYQLPAVMIYRVHWFWERFFLPIMLHTPHITLVNLLAGRRLYPEFVGARDTSSEIARVITDYLLDNRTRQKVVQLLKNLRHAYGAPGATERAAQAILNHIGMQDHQTRAA